MSSERRDMAKKSWKIDVQGTREVSRELKKLGKKLGMTADDWVDAAGKVSIRRIMERTQPYGLSESRHQMGENAVKRDIYRVFAPSWKRHALKFSEMEPYHAKARNKRGYVSDKESRERVIANKADLEKYLKLKMSHVGKAKGSWGVAYEALGWVLPEWIARHKGGTAKRVSQKGKGFWIFGSGVEYTKNNYVLGERGLVDALQSREKRLIKLLTQRVRKVEREAAREAKREAKRRLKGR